MEIKPITKIKNMYTGYIKLWMTQEAFTETGAKKKMAEELQNLPSDFFKSQPLEELIDGIELQ